MEKHLPVSAEDMKRRRWPELDFVLITGDAYVDHALEFLREWESEQLPGTQT